MIKRMNKAVKTATLCALLNIAYAIANLFVGIYKSSLWFVALGVYYSVLCVTRIAVILMRKRKNGISTLSYTGVMLILTTLPLTVTVALCYSHDVGKSFHGIIMISLALYSLTKITLAVINLIRSKGRSLPAERALRSISFADALVSIASFQRSMLVSFGHMKTSDIRLCNTLTGYGVCTLILALGFALTVTSKSKKQKSSA